VVSTRRTVYALLALGVVMASSVHPWHTIWRSQGPPIPKGRRDNHAARHPKHYHKRRGR